ncbi:MAG: Gfo/Idh/MocA family oxidoreductase [Acidobacteria bacterium]|nr:Gfo/Idh/MocA family oxidoreductase [Acidobacteriota bacterium]
MTERVRTGVVGVGYLGGLHTRVLTEIPEVELVGFVEPDDRRAGEIGEKFGLQRFDSVAAIAPEIEACVVATPTVEHHRVSVELLEAGVDVMIEKPITASLEEANELIGIAESNGRLIQVGHVERYNPAIVAAAPAVSEPRYVEAQRIGVFSARSLDIDVLLDLMIHDIHLVYSLIGKPVVEIRAIGIPVLTDRVDMANVRLEMEGGAVANLVASRVANDKMRKFRIFGKDSYVSVDTKDQDARGYRLLRDGDSKTVEVLNLEVERKEPLRAELDAFIDCVRSREKPLVDGRDGMAALELALRIGEEIERTTPV